MGVPAAVVILGAGCGDNIPDSASTPTELASTTTELGSTTTEESTVTTGDGSTTTESVGCAAVDGSTSTAPVKSQGTAIIHSSSGFDFDEGTEEADEEDVEVFWEIDTDTSRRLRPFTSAEVGPPAHYALIANLGPRNLESVTVEELLEAPYASEPINGGDAEDEMPVGTVIAVHTTEADVAKVRIEGRSVPGNQPGPHHLSVCWVTFDVAPPQVDGVTAGPGGGSGEVELIWSPVPAPADVASYRLYKRQSDGTELPPVSVSPDTLEGLPDGRLAITDAFDIGPWLTADPPGSRCYRVSAVSTAGVEGPASAEACGAPVGG